jgi:hypothetical protein
MSPTPKPSTLTSTLTERLVVWYVAKTIRACHWQGLAYQRYVEVKLVNLRAQCRTLPSQA